MLIFEAEYLRTLCICALVCKDWIHRSRLYLFRSIYIRDKAGSDTLQATFRENPSFRHLVRALHVTPIVHDGRLRTCTLHLALLLLRTMPSCTTKLAITLKIPLDNVTRRCLSMGYPHIVHLHLHEILSPIDRVHHLVNAFPSLRTLSYSMDRREIEPDRAKYNITLGCHRSRLTVRVCHHDLCYTELSRNLEEGCFPTCQRARAYFLRHSAIYCT